MGSSSSSLQNAREFCCHRRAAGSSVTLDTSQRGRTYPDTKGFRDETGFGDITNPTEDDHGFIRQVSTSPDDIGFIRQVSTSASSLGGNVDEFGDGEDSDFVRQVSTASALAPVAED